MHTGKTLFAQLMDFLPWKTFHRIVDRHDGNDRVRALSCAEQFRAMAFAQLTYRESLRDIEVCLDAQASKLYHMGFRSPVRRSTLADANEQRDWRIYATFAGHLIKQARSLYAQDSLDLDLANVVYALDSTTIDLCLSLFPWASFRSTKAAVKMHTLLDLRGSIPSFIHISDGKMGDVRVLDILPPEPGAFYVMDRGYLDFARLYAMHQAGAFFVTRAKSNFVWRRLYSAAIDRSAGLVCDHTIVLEGARQPQALPRKIQAHQIQRSRNRQDVRLSDQQFHLACIDDLRPLQTEVAGGAVFQMDKTTPAHQAILRHDRKRRQDANLDRRQRLRAHRDHQEASRPGRLALHFVTDFLAHALRKNARFSGLAGQSIQIELGGLR